MLKEPSIRKPGRDLGLMILFLIILGVLWYSQGGADKFPQGPFLEETPVPISDINQGNGGSDNGDDSSDNDSDGSNNGTASLYYRYAKQSDPQKEYVEIRAANSNECPLDITGWTIEGRVRLKLEIPQAAGLYISNQVNTQQDVFLEPGAKAIVVSGRSPIGSSFRLNKCIGYFAQSQEFNPYLPQKCPYPKDEEYFSSLSDDCRDYIKTLSRCRANFTLPAYLGNECIKAINETLNYNKCVELHKNDEDFYEDEWRIYLNRGDELWKKSYETITLRNKNGEIIDSVSY